MQILRMQKEFVKILKQKNQENITICIFKAIHLLLVDVFENFRDMCLEMYELDPANFLSVPGIAWKAASQKIKLDLISTCYQHIN